MEREISFSGEFAPAPKQSLTPGASYIGFRCPHCGQHFAILDDPAEGGPLTLSGAARFRASCPNCEAAGVFTTADLAIFAAAQGGPTSTA